jgi:hypothetical protein
MNAQINQCLTEVRKTLEADLKEMEHDGPAWGPDGGGKSGSDKHMAAEPGEGGADNISYGDQWYDMYMADMVTHLHQMWDMSEDEALSLVWEIAGELHSDGFIPEPPSDDADDEAWSTWIGKAKSAGLHGAVYHAAREKHAE